MLMASNDLAPDCAYLVFAATSRLCGQVAAGLTYGRPQRRPLGAARC